MADVSDNRIDEAYAAVRKEGGDTNWLVLAYDGNKKIVFVASGSGGVNEMAQQFKDDNCYYGYAKVAIKTDETTRTKFAFFTFKGASASVMRKGNVSIHSANVKSKIKDFSVQINSEDASEITEENVIARIKAANY